MSRERFAEGARLRYPIYDDRGVLLLRAGAVVTHHLLELLHRRGLKLRLDATLIVIEGATHDMRIPLTESHTEIGRAPTCAIRPKSREVSHHHCHIEKLPLSLSITDNGSTNGTWVNGMRITEQTELRNGDVVQFGKFGVRVDLRAALESDGEDVAPVAQLILATQDGEGDQEMGATVITTPVMAAVRPADDGERR